MATIRSDLNGVTNTHGLTALKKRLTTCFHQWIPKTDPQQQQQQQQQQQHHKKYYHPSCKEYYDSKKAKEIIKKLKKLFGRRKFKKKGHEKTVLEESFQFPAKLVSSTLIAATTITRTTTATTTERRAVYQTQPIMTIAEHNLLEIRDEFPELETDVRGILLARCHAGATIAEIKEDYYKNTGMRFPILYHITEYLLTIPSVSAICNEQGTRIFNIIPNEKTRHLYQLVMQQKSSLPIESADRQRPALNNRSQAWRNTNSQSHSHPTTYNRHHNPTTIKHHNPAPTTVANNNDNIITNCNNYNRNQETWNNPNQRHGNYQHHNYHNDDHNYHHNELNDHLNEEEVVSGGQKRQEMRVIQESPPPPFRTASDDKIETTSSENNNYNYYQDNCNYFYNRLYSQQQTQLAAHYNRDPVLQEQLTAKKNKNNSNSNNNRNLRTSYNNNFNYQTLAPVAAAPTINGGGSQDEDAFSIFNEKPILPPTKNKRKPDSRTSLTSLWRSSSPSNVWSSQTNESVLALDPVYDAHLLDFPLLGDDFFLYLARMELNCKFKKAQRVLQSGLCVSGQSIREATRRVRKLPSMQKRFIINLGSVDIMQGRSLVQIEHDLRDLINAMYEKGLAKPILTTLAPLANYGHDPQMKKKLERFNAFIKREGKNLDVIDIGSCMVNEVGHTRFDCYQSEPRQVTGASESYVFWNKIGRQRVLKMIEANIEYD